MFHSLKYLLLFLMIFIIGGSMYIATLNGNYLVKESRLIKAPVEVVFEEVIDFSNWKHWETWIGKEGQSVVQNTPKSTKEKAIYSWVNGEVKGLVKTISFQLNKQIIQEVDLGMNSNSRMSWDFVKTEEGTEVTVKMSGEKDFKEKIYELFKGKIENKIKPLLSKGLELLDKYLIKKIDEHSFTLLGPAVYGGGFYMYKSISCNISKVVEKSNPILEVISKFMSANSIYENGNKFVLFHQVDPLNKTALISVCIPVHEKISTDEDIFIGYLEPKRMYKLVLKGHYKYAEKALNLTYDSLIENGFEILENGEAIMVYKNTLANSPNPANWITEFFIPINY